MYRYQVKLSVDDIMRDLYGEKSKTSSAPTTSSTHNRTHCTYNYKDLKAGLPITLEEKLPIAFVRGRSFDQCLRFMNGYCDGLTGAVLEYAVSVHKS